MSYFPREPTTKFLYQFPAHDLRFHSYAYERVFFGGKYIKIISEVSIYSGKGGKCYPGIGKA